MTTNSRLHRKGHKDYVEADFIYTLLDESILEALEGFMTQYPNTHSNLDDEFLDRFTEYLAKQKNKKNNV